MDEVPMDTPAMNQRQASADELEENQAAGSANPPTSPTENSDEFPKDSDERKADAECDLSHKEVMDIVRTNLKEIVKDPLLCDLPSDVTTEEINLQLALEYGQAMAVNVRKQDGEVLSVVVLQGGTVQDLKQAIKRHVTMKQKREGHMQPISWRYVWRTYWLAFQGQKLDDDNMKIKDYGIRNRDEVTFIKRLKVKEIGY